MKLTVCCFLVLTFVNSSISVNNFCQVTDNGRMLASHTGYKCIDHQERSSIISPKLNINFDGQRTESTFIKCKPKQTIGDAIFDNMADENVAIVKVCDCPTGRQCISVKDDQLNDIYECSKEHNDGLNLDKKK